MSENILCSVSDLSKSYGRQQILDECQLEINEGEFIGLVGENGSGKTTFLKCLLGFTKPTSGEVKYNCSLGYCPQDNVLNNKLSVIEHFRFIETIYKKRYHIDRMFVDSLIEKFKLETYLDKLICNLSSGTYQKIKLMTALYHKPDLLLLDEPYDGFDWQMYNVFWEYIREFKNKNTGILMISHFVFENDKFDKIYELKDRKLELNE
ncbi:MAG: ABC transporter ATP-binding protein [Bacteroidota bacterium]